MKTKTLTLGKWPQYWLLILILFSSFFAFAEKLPSCTFIDPESGSLNCIGATAQVQALTCDSCSNRITMTPSGGTAPYSYIWLRNGVQLAGSGNVMSNLCPGKYTVVVSDANGCAVVKTVTVPPSVMSPGAIKIVNQYCYKDFKTKKYRVHFDVQILGGTGPYTVELVGVLPPGQNTGFSLPPNTTITIRVVDSRGCVGTITFRTLNCYIIEPGDPFPPIGLELYPNPNQGIFTLGVSFSEPSPIEITILDQSGNPVYYSDQGFPEPGTYTYPIDISSAPAGTYHLLINEGQASTTFIKQ